MDEQQRISDVASSSNSSSKKYDVFLSFRGEDTRMNFTSLLYDALTKEKIETFIDDRGLEKGDEISPALVKAMEESHISVVIFSENYASSKWCLNELIKILELRKEKGQIVIPVFYNTDPSDVRKQTGSYEKAFTKHEGEPMCGKWKAALTEAANLSGWHSQNRTESELLKSIVRDVLKILPPTYPNQSKRLVGIQKSCEEIESLLKIGSDEVITLGIWGMGGTGKTTLAKALYDKLSYDFEGCCFLANVTEESNKHEDLCKKLFSTLFKEEKHFDRSNMSRLRPKRVFIVLDDVSTAEQLKKLIAEYNFLGAGSRVIVTTRDKHILSTDHKIYQVEEMNSHYSLQLFCLAVFGEKQPKQGYEDLSKSVISYCKGLPLALEVLGASLRDRNEEAWECELRKLQEIPNMHLHKVLKLSYDGLDRSQKDIFLDIACFFKGEERDRIKGILEASGFYAASGITTLLDKALITISHDNKIEMHDLIQEMGREIVHQESEKYPENRSRLWKYEEVFGVLKDNKGTDDVEGIILNLVELKGDLYLSSDFLAKMTNVRFLKIHKECWWGGEFNVYLRGGLESLSDKLRYLHWDRCSLKRWPPNFYAEQLVELCMQDSNLKKLWDGVQNLMNLKSIDLSFSRKLVEIPDLSKAEKLEKVSLAYCYSLHQLHPSVLSLPKLTYLNLDCCSNIEILESNVHSKSLKELRLRDCSSLKKFSVTSDEIKVLNLSNSAICALSPSIGDLLSLEVLYLSGTNVESLPENIKNLSMLTRLQLEDCKELVSLPELPPSLRKLYLDRCKKLVSLSELPSSLTELSLYECENLVSLSELPSSLEALYLISCWKLESLPELPLSLRKLALDNCKKLMSLPELPLSLRELPLDNCKKLMSLPELPRTMKKVSAYNCISLKTDITQGLVLKHMLQYLKNPEFCDLDYFIFPGDHVIKECGFHAAESLITISYLPKSDLFGFIYCIIFSEGQDLDVWGDGWDIDLSIYIYQDGIEVGGENKPMECSSDLYSDHVFFSYVDVSGLGRITEVDDQFGNITFIFELEDNKERIKGCGVFPVYATTSGLKLVGHDQENLKGCGVFAVSSSSLELNLVNSSSQELFELDLISQISNNESQAREIAVGGLGDENEENRKQFLEWWDSIAQISDSEAQARAIGVGGSNNANEDDRKQFLEWWDSIAQISDSESQARAIGVGGSNNENEDDQKQFLEWWDSIAQISDNEAQARATGVGGSGNENEDGWEQLLPASKRQRTSP